MEGYREWLLRALSGFTTPVLKTTDFTYVV
jgi:hypothetical protein